MKNEQTCPSWVQQVNAVFLLMMIAGSISLTGSVPIVLIGPFVGMLVGVIIRKTGTLVPLSPNETG